jgi:uncharacterized damage-inducible protein DinB
MDAAAKLSDDNLRRNVGIGHQSVFGTLVHMAGAEWIWPSISVLGFNQACK